MDWTIFDIIGPIMIGPSSSHTAGAAGLGHFAYLLSGGDIKSIKITLYGSFARVYKGHGTDWAILGGVLGMKSDDNNLCNAFKIAKKQGLHYEFVYETNEKVKHPNTVKFDIILRNGKVLSIIGASVGGGSIEISEINGVKVKGIDGREGKIIAVGNEYRQAKNALANVISSKKLIEIKRNKNGCFVLTAECEENEASQMLSAIEKTVQVTYFPKMNV